VETGSNRVVVDWRGSAQPGGVQEVLIKYRCGKFPSLGEFYILIYDDHFQGVVHECWHVCVQSRLRLDVNSCVGQATSSELVIQGDKFARRVQLFSSSPAEVEFDPGRQFQLVPGAFNRAACKFKMRSAGQQKVHVHMVDMDTKELVCAWLVTVNSALPVITKVYDVQLPVGCSCSKKLRCERASEASARAKPTAARRQTTTSSFLCEPQENLAVAAHQQLAPPPPPPPSSTPLTLHLRSVLSFTNQWDKVRRYKLCSSDEGIMRPRNGEVDIESRAVGYMRLYFNPVDVVGTHEVILFVNDEHDQNEESFLLKLHVS
jgi:hypothetical protein